MTGLTNGTAYSFTVAATNPTAAARPRRHPHRSP
jgi:hypothetical protein